MRNPGPKLIVLVLLVLGVSVVVPADDLLETAFDESQDQPCECAALISYMLPSASGDATQQRESPTRRQSTRPRQVTKSSSISDESRRSAAERTAPALLCTFLL
jgi:hypothetical protein